MKTSLRIVFSLFLAGFGAMVLAAPMGPGGTSRYVMTFADDSTVVQATGLGSWNETIQENFNGGEFGAFQDSLVDFAGGHLSGQGTAFSSLSLREDDGLIPFLALLSVYRVSFELFEPASYSLSGSVSSVNQDLGLGEGLWNYAEVGLYDDNSGVFIQKFSTQEGDGSFGVTGQLDPGFYSMLVRADARYPFPPPVPDNREASFQFDFAVAAVPEPGTWALLLGGLGLLGSIARRRGCREDGSDLLAA